jgi:hypothetical protein
MAPEASRPALRPATPSRAPHRLGGSWWLGVCAAVLVALTGSVPAGLWLPGRLFVPGGATTLVLSTDPIPPPGALGRAVAVLRVRLAAAGYDRPSVRVTGPRTVTVRLDGHPDPEPVRALVAPGRVSFRTIVAGPVDTGPGAPPRGEPAGDLEALRRKLGPVYDWAAKLTDPSQVNDPDAYAVFGTLRPEEVALLPPVVQFSVPAIPCVRVGGGNAGPIAACQPGTGKYLLDPATVRAPDVEGAGVVLDAHLGWSAGIRFTPTGSGHWAALLEAVRHTVSHRVAVVLDHRVVATPRVDEPGTNDGLVTQPGLDPYGAQRLAAILDSGPLPVTFTVDARTSG